MPGRIRCVLAALRGDVGLAVRQLRGSPGFTWIAAATLALGIGANSALFALADAALLRPLPFPEADRLVMIWERTDAAPRSYVSPLNYRDWVERSQAFESMAGYAPGVGGMVMNGADGTAETVSRHWVTTTFFDVLRVQALAGRTFSPQDEEQRANVVVLSEPFWRMRF